MGRLGGVHGVGSEVPGHDTSRLGSGAFGSRYTRNLFPAWLALRLTSAENHQRDRVNRRR